jgi:hypothetical protein
MQGYVTIVSLLDAMLLKHQAKQFFVAGNYE